MTTAVQALTVQSGGVIENPRSGEQVEFVSETSEALTMLTTWTRPGHRAPEHVHPNMEERFEVLEGRAAFRVDGVEIVAGAGEVVVARPGSRHLAWNPTGALVRLKIEMRALLCGGRSSPAGCLRARIRGSSSASTAPRSSSRSDKCPGCFRPCWPAPVPVSAARWPSDRGYPRGTALPRVELRTIRAQTHSDTDRRLRGGGGPPLRLAARWPTPLHGARARPPARRFARENAADDATVPRRRPPRRAGR